MIFTKWKLIHLLQKFWNNKFWPFSGVLYTQRPGCNWYWSGLFNTYVWWINKSISSRKFKFSVHFYSGFPNHLNIEIASVRSYWLINITCKILKYIYFFLLIWRLNTINRECKNYDFKITCKWLVKKNNHEKIYH